MPPRPMLRSTVWAIGSKHTWSYQARRCRTGGESGLLSSTDSTILTKPIEQTVRTVASNWLDGSDCPTANSVSGLMPNGLFNCPFGCVGGATVPGRIINGDGVRWRRTSVWTLSWEGLPGLGPVSSSFSESVFSSYSESGTVPFSLTAACVFSVPVLGWEGR